MKKSIRKKRTSSASWRKSGSTLTQAEIHDQWKKLCEELGTEVLEKSGAEGCERGASKGRDVEPQWIIKKEDYRKMKEGSMREKMPIREQGWGRLASFFEGLQTEDQKLAEAE